MTQKQKIAQKSAPCDPGEKSPPQSPEISKKKEENSLKIQWAMAVFICIIGFSALIFFWPTLEKRLGIFFSDPTAVSEEEVVQILKVPVPAESVEKAVPSFPKGPEPDDLKILLKNLEEKWRQFLANQPLEKKKVLAFFALRQDINLGIPFQHSFKKWLETAGNSEATQPLISLALTGVLSLKELQKSFPNSAFTLLDPQASFLEKISAWFGAYWTVEKKVKAEELTALKADGQKQKKEVENFLNHGEIEKAIQLLRPLQPFTDPAMEHWFEKALDFMKAQKALENIEKEILKQTVPPDFSTTKIQNI
jgi:hypothetical protein